MVNSSKGKLLVICHINNSNCNGQIAKTKDVCAFLNKEGYQVDLLNYGKMNIFQKLFSSKNIIKKYDKVVLMPGGKKALFFYINIIHQLKIKNAHYVAIGGWVLTLLKDEKNKKYFDYLKEFKGVYLQNQDAVEAFEDKGFKNVYFISSFSTKTLLTQEQQAIREDYYKNVAEFKFCFFARVERTKGVLLACDCIKKIKEKHPNIPVSLDIFGEIKDPELKEELIQNCKEFPYISYKGVLGNDAISILANYYCLLFPTYYHGEGTPHSVIEAFMAGLPVIASDWAYNKEVVSDNKTGLIFKLNTNELYEKIIWAINNSLKIGEFSKNCLLESKKYNIDNLLKPLLTNLEN